jgi:MoxR-like ATPase
VTSPTEGTTHGTSPTHGISPIREAPPDAATNTAADATTATATDIDIHTDIDADAAGLTTSAGRSVLRPHAEQAHAAELQTLAASDDRARPPSWRMSPWAVVTYLMGGVLADGTVVTPKYIGPRRLIEVAVATLATDRALLLLGLPGTAKTWVSEHLAAAVSGDSTLLVQGTSGTSEEAIRYGWNYARLLAEGPSEAALVPSPVMTAMRRGSVARVEELTRIPSEVQDALITVLSEKALPVPELGIEVQARPGFSVIATANDRDRGVNELSSALRRRFNTVVLPLPATEDEEVDIVSRRVEQLGTALQLPPVPTAMEEIRRVVRVFRELRSGVTTDGRTAVKSPSGTLSTAEAISVVTHGLALSAHFGDGVLRPGDVAGGILGAVVKDPVSDRVVWTEYLEAVVRDRDGWGAFYRACREVAG